jgi:hypothetical protein
MNIFSKLFGTKARSPSNVESIPKECFQPSPPDTDDLFALFQNVLPPMCSCITKRGKDVVILLIAFQRPQWKGLVHRLYEHADSIYLSPDSLCGSKPLTENIGDRGTGACWVYSPPRINGKVMQTGVFAVERASLLQAACSVHDIPMFFLQCVKSATIKPGQLEVLIFSTTGLATKHTPIQ